MDKLDLLFKKQYDLQVQGMHYDFANMTTEQRAAYVKEYTMHCEHELHEALQEIPFFKPWKRYDKDDETELLIRVLSFGPVLQVTDPPEFASLVKERLSRQSACFSPGGEG